MLIKSRVSGLDLHQLESCLLASHLKGLNREEELSSANHTCVGQALATAMGPCHPGACPWGRGPSELFIASDPSGERDPGRGCWIKSCLVPASVWVTLGHLLFLVSRKPTLLPTGASVK